jgi:hypothetical protein
MHIMEGNVVAITSASIGMEQLPYIHSTANAVIYGIRQPALFKLTSLLIVRQNYID